MVKKLQCREQADGASRQHLSEDITPEQQAETFIGLEPRRDPPVTEETYHVCEWL